MKNKTLSNEKKLTTLRFDFFFPSVTDADTNLFQLIHIPDNMLVTYFENDEGQKITKIPEGDYRYSILPSTK